MMSIYPCLQVSKREEWDCPRCRSLCNCSNCRKVSVVGALQHDGQLRRVSIQSRCLLPEALSIR